MFLYSVISIQDHTYFYRKEVFLMPVKFFKTELRKLQDRFNETFGAMVTCDLKTRQKIILTIAGLGLLERKISTSNKDSVRAEIRQFVKHNFRALINIFAFKLDHNRENSMYFPRGP
jgi:hypothetical protein